MLEAQRKSLQISGVDSYTEDNIDSCIPYQLLTDSMGSASSFSESVHEQCLRTELGTLPYAFRAEKVT